MAVNLKGLIDHYKLLAELDISLGCLSDETIADSKYRGD